MIKPRSNVISDGESSTCFDQMVAIDGWVSQGISEETPHSLTSNMPLDQNDVSSTESSLDSSKSSFSHKMVSSRTHRGQYHSSAKTSICSFVGVMSEQLKISSSAADVADPSLESLSSSTREITLAHRLHRIKAAFVSNIVIWSVIRSSDKKQVLSSHAAMGGSRVAKSHLQQYSVSQTLQVHKIH
jgi:hypothetical protein